MESRSYTQYAIVDGDTAEQLEEKLNARLLELRRKYPKVAFQGLIAQVQYTETEQIPETLAEEYELQGVRLTCQDCPFFVPMYKADGSEDRRAKWGGCPWIEHGRTSRTSRACDQLFEMLNNGEVRLCLNHTK